MADGRVAVRQPTVEEYIALRRAVGWGAPEAEAAREALAHSLFGVCVESQGQAVGCARVVGDGFLVFYIQDVIVHPEHQGRGYGRMLMDEVMAYIARTAQPTAVVGLFAAKGKEGFYRRYGFLDRPDDRFGAGMHWFRG